MPLDPSDVLLSKARDDERLALLVVGNSAISDEQVGFLAQQAIEKAVKAVLCFKGIAYRRTHDLSELIDLARSAGIEIPPDLGETIWLTPFAAEMRYDYLPPEQESPLDRSAAMRWVRVSIEWAGRMIEAAK